MVKQNHFSAPRGNHKRSETILEKQSLWRTIRLRDFVRLATIPLVLTSVGRPFVSYKRFASSFLLPTATWTYWNITNNTHEQEEENRRQHSYEYPFEFAACLLIRDDNLLLPEWLAYHYTALPLRYVIVAVGPLSTTSPLPILRDFASLTDLKIEFWKGNFYFYDGRWSKEQIERFNPHNHSREHGYLFHLQRQKAFYTRCLQRLKNVPNISLTLIVDSDEYVTYNTILDPKSQSQEIEKQLPSKIGAQNETIAHWFAKHPEKMPQLCQIYPQLRFSSNDKLSNLSDYYATLRKSIPADIRNRTSIDSFMSLRYTSHINIHKGQEPGKSIVNLGAYSQDMRVGSCHRPFLDACGKHMRFSVMDQTYPIRTHHYSGSLQNWLSRPSRTVKMWEDKHQGPISGTDQSLSEWFHHFVALVGKNKAQKLTVDHNNAALKEWQDIKVRVEQHETIPMVFEWDDPIPLPVIVNHSDYQVLPKVTAAQLNNC